MVSILKSACIILSVFLSLGFSSAHRFLLDQAIDDHKNMDPVNLEALKNPKGEGVGVGYGTGSASGSGSFTGYGSGVGARKGSETSGYRSRIGKGVGNWGRRHGSGIGPGPGGPGHGFGKGVGYGSCSRCAPGCVPGFTVPIPTMPKPNPNPPMPILVPGRDFQFPTVPDCQTGPSVGDGYIEGPIPYCCPSNNNGLGNCKPEPHHGESAAGAAKVMQEAKNIASEPYPPDIHHSQP